MSDEQWYAIVFKRRFAPGQHWLDHLPERVNGQPFKPGEHRPEKDDPDRKQDWQVGELYSVGTVLPDELPAHLEAIPIDGPQNGRIWDKQKKRFIENPDAVSIPQ